MSFYRIACRYMKIKIDKSYFYFNFETRANVLVRDFFEKDSLMSLFEIKECEFSRVFTLANTKQYD